MPAAAIAPAIIGTATVGSALIGASASRSAANAQANAANAAAAEQARQYDQTRQDQMPWMDAGRGALTRLQDPQANFLASPGYEFARNEGMRGIQQSAAAGGGLMSGNALRDLTQYGTGLAQQEYGNWWNQQAGLAGLGQTATQAVGQAGMNSANNIGNALLSAGNARASGILGSANSITGSINSGLNNWLLYRGGAFNGLGSGSRSAGGSGGLSPSLFGLETW